eukprot:SAG31_NODE_108_length_24741_cov_6.933041_11_plen_239_part_00
MGFSLLRLAQTYPLLLGGGSALALTGVARALGSQTLRMLVQRSDSGSEAPSVSDFMLFSTAAAPRQPPPDPTQLAVVDVLPDGNCLFNAIAVSQHLNTPVNPRLLSPREVQREARKLRTAANDFLCPRGRPSKQEVGGLPLDLIMEPRGAEGGRGYCRRLRRDGEWGSMAEIIALSEVLCCPIAVYHRRFGRIELQDTYGGQQPGHVIPIFYVNGNHYMALQDVTRVSDAGSSGRSKL